MPKLNIPTPVLVATLTAFLGGGLAGAIFNYYVNRPQPSILMYTVTTTTIASSEAATFIPDLRVEVGKDTVKSLFVHAIEVSLASGPFVQQADIALVFPNKPHVYGTDAASPSPVHSISCVNPGGVIRCHLSPIASDSARPYKVSIGTDTSEAPTPVMAMNGVRLISAKELADLRSGFLSSLKGSNVALGIATIAYLSMTSYVIRRLRRIVPGRLIVVGKIKGPDGSPLSDALVEVAVEQPHASRRSARTDAMGDFITGGIGLRKEPFFSARVRVTHPSVPTAEFATNSAIVSYQYPAGTEQEPRSRS